MTGYDNKVLQQQEAIRQSGMINMFDKGGVKRIARDMGSTELVEFIESATGAEYVEMAEQAAEQLSP